MDISVDLLDVKMCLNSPEFCRSHIPQLYQSCPHRCILNLLHPDYGSPFLQKLWPGCFAEEITLCIQLTFKERDLSLNRTLYSSTNEMLSLGPSL